MMNNLEVALSTVTVLITGTAVFTAIKTLLDARNKSIDEFIKERNSRREIQSKKNQK
jgi:hypothetical protein